ncbi:MAG TPA: 4-hydroxy-tetrahydrodipicolinate reductase [Syntrophorhabdaceae bacterium]|nr:4-hydroxy-tetrahydrodipicolinate reductase [Syntrophorhabdaceae bacterium]HQM80882.1 4-hydroxy-tetrahydrodipicolinate reductase [Syntrophorhabdaceae bacterium]
MIKLAITGVGGKMGSAILKLAAGDRDFQVTAALEKRGHPMVGQPAGPIVRDATGSLTITDDMAQAIDACDVIIDFTEPGTTMDNFHLAREKQKCIVIGTTGLPEDALNQIKSTVDAKTVISPNMSVGMNLMFDIVDRVSKILQDGYDIEIVEMHHRWKKDAPSGTAMRLKDIVKGAQPGRQWEEIYGRKGLTGERKSGEIAVLGLRGGDIVGEHTVMYAGIGERFEITHRAYSRDNFALGALMAAKWIVRQPPGIYGMKDVLGL